MAEALESIAQSRGRRNVTRVTYNDDKPQVMTDCQSSSTTRKTSPPQRKKTSLPPPIAITTRVAKHAPARTIQGFLDIEAHFRVRIRDQDTAIQHIAASLSRALSSIPEEGVIFNKADDQESSESSIYTMTLCGPTGCGKTETVLALKNFFGMDTGYEYESQFVELDGSTYGESTQINSVTGGGAGLIGYQDGNSLSERLLKAIADYQTSEEAPLPPYLMLFIDEIDKADPGFLRNLNGLLGAGKYVSPSGNSFYLPAGVLLFVVLTANYGAQAIVEMGARNDELAQKYIEEDMRSLQMQNYTIGRLGQILPYYPIKREILYAIMADKLDAFIARSPIAKRHGVHNILYKDEVKARLINTVLDKWDTECGIRGSMEQLFKTINLLFEISFAKLNAMIRAKECSPELNQSIHIDTHSFDVKELFRKEIKQILHKDIIDTIREIPVNRQCIEQCPLDHEGVVNAVGMRYGDKQLCNLIMGFNFHTIVNNYGSVETTQITQSLQEKLKRAKRKEKIMRGCLAELSDATSKKTTLKQIKRIIERNKALLSESQSDESDDHEQCSVIVTAAVKKIPKRMMIEEEEEERPRKRQRRASPPRYTLVARDDVTIEEVTVNESDGEYSIFNDDEIAEIFLLAQKEAEEEARAARGEDFTFDEATPSDSYGDDEDEDENDNGCTIESVIRDDLLGNRRAGRPPREYVGFRRMQTKDKTALIQCRRCEKTINSRYAKNHKCENVK